MSPTGNNRLVEYFFIVGLNENTALPSKLIWPQSALNFFSATDKTDLINCCSRSISNLADKSIVSLNVSNYNLNKKRPSLSTQQLDEKELPKLPRSRNIASQRFDSLETLPEFIPSKAANLPNANMNNSVSNLAKSVLPKQNKSTQAIKHIEATENIKATHLQSSMAELSYTKGTTILEKDIAELKCINPIHYKYAAELLSRYPETNYSDKEKLPAFLSLFCFPRDLQFKQTAERPPPATHHSFTMTEEDGSRLYGTCLTVWEPLTDKTQSTFEAFLTSWRKLALDPKDLEYLDHLEQQLRKQEDLIHKLDKEHGFDENLAISETYLKERRKANEKRQLYLDMLKPLRETLSLETGTVYAPKCVGLLSRWPWYSFCKDWLCEVVLAQNKPGLANTGIFENLVTHLIKGTPLPPAGRLELSFKINRKSLFFSRPAGNAKMCNFLFYPIFRSLSAETITTVFELLLTEQQVVFVSSYLSMLNIAVETFTALAEPFKWQFVSIPVLPERLIHYLQAPLPYLVGILRDIYEECKLAPGSPACEAADDVKVPAEAFIIDLDNDIVRGPRRNEASLLPTSCRSFIIGELQASFRVKNSANNLKNERKVKGVPKGMKAAFTESGYSMPLSCVSRNISLSGKTMRNANVAALQASLNKVSSLKSVGLSRTSVSNSLHQSSLSTVGDSEKVKRLSLHRKSLSTNSRKESKVEHEAGLSFKQDYHIHSDGLYRSFQSSMTSLSSSGDPKHDLFFKFGTSESATFPGSGSLDFDAVDLQSTQKAKRASKYSFSDEAFNSSNGVPGEKPLPSNSSPEQSPTEVKINTWKEAFDGRRSMFPLEEVEQRRKSEGHLLSNYRYDLYKAAMLGDDPLSTEKQFLMQSLLAELVEDSELVCQACFNPLCGIDTSSSAVTNVADKIYVSVCLNCAQAFHIQCTDDLEMHPCECTFDIERIKFAFLKTLGSLVKNYSNFLIPINNGKCSGEPGNASEGLLVHQKFFRKTDFILQFSKYEKPFISRLADTQAFNLFMLQRLEQGMQLDDGEREFDQLAKASCDKWSVRSDKSASRGPPNTLQSALLSNSGNELAGSFGKSSREGSETLFHSNCVTNSASRLTATEKSDQVTDTVAVYIPPKLQVVNESCTCSHVGPLHIPSKLNSSFIDPTETAEFFKSGIVQFNESNSDEKSTTDDIFARLRNYQRDTMRQQFKSWLKNKINYFADMGQEQLIAFGLLNNDERASLFALKLEQIQHTLGRAEELFEKSAPLDANNFEQYQDMLEELYDRNFLVMNMADDQEAAEAEDQLEFQKAFSSLFKHIARFEEALKVKEDL